MRCSSICRPWRSALRVASVVLGLYFVFSVAASAQQMGHTWATVEIPPVIEVISWPSSDVELAGMHLDEEWRSNQLVLEVRTNTPWRVEVQTDSETGTLREFDTAQGVYVQAGQSSVNPVYLELVETGERITLGSIPAVLAESAAPTGGAGQEIRFYIRFRPTFDDVPLQPGHTYRVQLTYIVGMGF